MKKIVEVTFLTVTFSSIVHPAQASPSVSDDRWANTSEAKEIERWVATSKLLLM